MMKCRLLFILLLEISFASGQSVTGLNFSHWYNPKNEVDLRLTVARGEEKLLVHYQLKTSGIAASNYTIRWESRASYNQREGELITGQDSSQVVGSNLQTGSLSFALPSKPWLLLAKVTHLESQRSWFYFKLVEAIYPVKGWVENEPDAKVQDSKFVLAEKYLTKGNSYRAKSVNEKPLFVSYYKTTFPQPNPPFTEKGGTVERFLFHDSVFQVASGSAFVPKQYGLYLFQQDTTVGDGFSMRAVDENYPKLNKIDDLISPLIYVTTPEEYSQLQKVNGNKPAFDKIILSITRDKERAKTFMRSYFQRVESANRYFSSYKEGWKTDRGMIYTIFGTPDELGKNQGNEVWTYKNFNVRFTFVKSGSVYDADNYVLLRDKRFNEAWFGTIDLWRKSRF
jgi:GWxTD domain-containing protein